jgi:hypothetical protein
MSKKLNETTIVNELRGHSAFFRQPTPTPAEPPPETAVSERTEIRTEDRSEKRTDHLPVKRLTKRYSFEFYDDQIVQLKRLKRDAEDRGENLTLSDMAREAFDQYLNRKVIHADNRSA